MHGRILLDTNAVIYALNRGVRLRSAHYIISVITEIELFSYPKLSQIENENLKNLLRNFEIHPLNEPIKEMTIHIRKTHNIKIPDSIITATALVEKIPLVSYDKQLARIGGLELIGLEELQV